MRIMEQGGMCAGSQHMQAGRLSDTDTEQSVLESFGRGEEYSDCVTEHQVGTDGGAGGVTLRPTEREHQSRIIAGDKAGAGHTHPA